MAYSIADLRAFGEEPVRITTRDGDFEGRIVTERLSDAAVVVLLRERSAPATDPPLVFLLDDIENVATR